jgi:hypothetical protein
MEGCGACIFPNHRPNVPIQYTQAGSFRSRIVIVLHDCMLVGHSDDIAANRFLACTSIEEEINSPEERALIS